MTSAAESFQKGLRPGVISRVRMSWFRLCLLIGF